MSEIPIQKNGPIVQSAEDEALFSKISWRLLPLLIICYVIAFLDRINIGFAQLQMKESLEFSSEAFALGASIFFLGYFLFEVPSNLVLERIGARKTLLRIMFCWGIVASAMMFVQTPTQFYILRFLLGAFEAGFFPGIILYLTYWYPSAQRGRVICIFMSATALAYLIAGPLSGGIMKYMDGLMGQQGWQWLFVVQGLPASILGLFVFFYLQDRPDDAKWLTDDEKTRVRHLLDNDTQSVETASHGSLVVLLRDPKVYTLSLVYFLGLGATYTMIFWLPTLIQSWGVADVFWVGVLTSVPALFGVVGMILLGRSSDRRRERRMHFLFATVLAGGGLLATIFMQGNLVAAIACFCVMSVGQSSFAPLFFTAISEYLPKKTAAGGIALVSSLGNLGPFFAPPIMARINSLTGSPTASMYAVAALFLLSGLLLTVVLKPASERPQSAMA